jgi:hypothetical protein
MVQMRILRKGCKTLPFHVSQSQGASSTVVALDELNICLRSTYGCCCPRLATVASFCILISQSRKGRTTSSPARLWPFCTYPRRVLLSLQQISVSCGAKRLLLRLIVHQLRRSGANATSVPGADSDLTSPALWHRNEEQCFVSAQHQMNSILPTIINPCGM